MSQVLGHLPRVALLGAHRAWAKALAEVIEERGLELELRRYTDVAHLGEASEPYGPASDGAACVVLASADPAPLERARAARAQGVPVIDATGALRGEPGAVQVVSLSPDLSLGPGALVVVCPGLAGPLVAVLAALAEAAGAGGLSRVAVATYEGAAAADQPGLDELSEQVRGVYTLREVEPVVFPARLAFSVVPGLAPPGEDADAADEALAAELRAGLAQLGAAVPELDVARALVPTFSGEVARVFADATAEVTRDEVITALGAARGLRLVEHPTAADALGRDDVLVGRVTVRRGRVGLWLASDRLRAGSVTGVALLLERWLG